MSFKMSSARTYVLYENYDGTATNHWQYRGRLKVPGGMQNTLSGQVYPPPIRWAARARSAKEACYFANGDVRSEDREDGLGIYWDRERDDGPPPLGRNLEEFWALVATCRALTISLWEHREDAEWKKRILDESGCGGGCHGVHEIVRMTADEASRRRPDWWTFAERDRDGFSNV